MGWNVPYPEMNPEEEKRWCGKPHYCPVCGDECEFYFVQDGEVLGCENCIKQEYADEMDV